MRIKKVILKGFKTFPKKTEIVFKEGLNIIVGPNGTGKSNIIDAIRWALGERSVKSLRGSNLEDVIFNGTDEINPSNFAEVSIVFDNTDRKLRLDFDEVEFTRHFSKDGSGKFYINKKRARLKEIESLIADTGISSNSYAVIEQGQVEKFINYSPFEKRYIFEEAAGIMFEKKEKEDAQRKLEKTEENLLRIKDIIFEKDKQQSVLKRSVKKFERYSEFKEEMNHLKRKSIGLKYSRCKTELEELNKAKDPFILEKTNLLSVISRLNSEITSIEKEISDLYENHSSGMNRKLELSNKIQKLEGDRQTLENDIKNKKEAIQNNENTVLVSKGKIEKYNEDINSWQEKISHKNKLNVELDKKVEELQKKTEKENEELSVLVKDSAEVEKIYLDFSGKLSEIENQKIKVVTQKNSNDNQIEKIIIRMDNFKSRIKAFESDLNETEKELEKVKKEYENKLNEKNTLSERISETETGLNNINDSISGMATAINSLKEKIKLLDNSIYHYEGFSEGVKNVMKKSKMRDEALGGIHDVVANLIEYDPEHTVALETAFGAVLQYVITDTEDDAKRAISYLNRVHGGRATFITLDRDIREHKQHAIEKTKGVIGWVTDLYNAQHDYKELIDRFVSNILVVENMDIASAMKKKLAGKFFKIVTKNGELFHSDGRIVGGKRRDASGLLSLKETLRSEEKNLDKLNADHEKLLEEQSELKKERADLISKIEVINRSEREYIVKINKISGDHNTIKANIENLNNNKKIEEESLELLRSESKTFEADLKKIDSEIEKLKKGNAQIQDKYKKYQNDLADIRDRINSLNREREKYENDIRLNEYDISNMNENIEKFSQLNQELKSDIDYLEKEIKEFKSIIEKNKKDIQKAIEDITQLSATLRTFDIDIEKAGDEIKSKEEIKNKKRTELEKKSTEYEELQNKLAEIESGNLDLKVEIQKQYDHLRTLFKNEEDIQKYLDDLTKTESELDKIDEKLSSVEDNIEKLGPINFEAVEEYDNFLKEYQEIKDNYNDIIDSKNKLQEIINMIEDKISDRFKTAIENINVYFSKTFAEMFGGGEAKVKMLNPENPLETGIDMEVLLPGENFKSINLRSGGEKAIVTAALLFAIFLQNPTSVCILDEVDAPMDEINLVKFFNGIKGFGKDIQFIIITHNKRSMEFANTLYGATMEKRNVTSVLSLELKD